MLDQVLDLMLVESHTSKLAAQAQPVYAVWAAGSRVEAALIRAQCFRLRFRFLTQHGSLAITSGVQFSSHPPELSSVKFSLRTSL